MSFAVQPIIDRLKTLSDGKTVWIAFSGGLDSHVLVHLVSANRSQFPQAIKLIHIDHQLQDDSAVWASHCQAVATALQLPIHVLKVNVDPHGLGLEAAARQARYQAIADYMHGDGVLVTGQHQQDQAETLMLQLLRGAGNRGLSAMKMASAWQGMPVLRPLIDVDRQALSDYAEVYQLHYLDDPSNDDCAIQRNYLRHQVWPILHERWPALNQSLSRSAAHLQESQQLLDELAQQDMHTLQADFSMAKLNVQALLHLNHARQRNALRYFLHQLNLPMPSTVILQRILREVCTARDDGQPQVSWAGITVRRFQGLLYVDCGERIIDPDWQLLITQPQSISLPDGQKLNWQSATKAGIGQNLIENGLMLRYRRGGEKIQLAGHQRHHHLKNCFQQWQIPPWQRSRIPLLFAGDQLIAVVGYALSEKALAAEGEEAWIPLVKSAEQADFD